MRKYLAIIGGVAVVVSAALLIPSDSYGYVRKGELYGLPAGCGAKIATAIQSVYPNANMSHVKRWGCNRTWENEETPNGAECGGRYCWDLDVDEWADRVYATDGTGGFAAWEPESRTGSTVTVCKTVAFKLLDAAQITAHAPLFSGCMLDDDSAELAWADMKKFSIEREQEAIQIQVWHITSTAIAEELADARIAKKAIATVGEAP